MHCIFSVILKDDVACNIFLDADVYTVIEDAADYSAYKGFALYNYSDVGDVANDYDAMSVKKKIVVFCFLFFF